MSVDFETVVRTIGDLPPMPAVAMKVLQQLQDPNVSTASLATTIQNDPAVSARVLKIANSAFYSMRRQVRTLEHALVVVGEKTLRSLVLAASLEVMNKQVGLLEKMLWEDSLGCAVGARLLARRFRTIEPEEAFLGGLFRHLGLIVMNFSDRERFSVMVQASYSGAGTLTELEKVYFPYSHELVGAAVLDKWNFSKNLIQCALHHSDLDVPQKEEPELFRLVATVNLADNMALRLGIGQREPNSGHPVAGCAGAKALGVGAEQIEDALCDLEKVFAENREFFFG